MNSESVIDKSSSSTEQKEVDPIGYQLTTILLFFFLVCIHIQICVYRNVSFLSFFCIKLLIRLQRKSDLDIYYPFSRYALATL